MQIPKMTPKTNKSSSKHGKKGVRKVILWMSVSAAVLVTGTLLFAAYCNYVIMECRQYCYSNIESVPEADTALLPGAAKIAPSGNPNKYFAARIRTAAELFSAGKVKHFLISGDNSRKDYDEPTDMKNALLEYGVPETAMTLDYAGFRTLDSIVRAKNVFGKNEFLIITQPGHAERAVYIARKHNIKATAFYAPEPLQYPNVVKRNRRREKLACPAAWIDTNILNRQPKFIK